MLAPAIWSALAIGFAESISDFGVAATLAYNSNFSLATYQLYAAIGNFPPNFPLASAMGTLLVAAVAIPLALQARALRGRSYQFLSGRNRQVIRRQLSRPAAIAAAAGVGLFYLIALGVPALRRGQRVTARRLRRVVHADPGQLPGAAARDRPDRPAGTLADLRDGHRVHHGDRRLRRRLAAGPAAHQDEVHQGAGLPAAGRDRAAQRGVRGRLHLRLQPADLVPDRHQPVPDHPAADHRVRRVQPAHQRPGAGRRGVAAAALAQGRGPRARGRRR